MKNTTLLLLMIIFVTTGAFFAFTSAEEDRDVAQNPTLNNGEVQKITLSEKNFNYYPETVTVQAGKPVEITLDRSVQGCLRSLTFPQLGVSKYLKNAADTLVFTPTQKGVFKYSCSMGMGFGTLVVQ